jgi:hypothetical protein
MKRNFWGIGVITVLILSASFCFAGDTELRLDLQQKVLAEINCILHGSGLQYAMTRRLGLPDTDAPENFYPRCDTGFFQAGFSSNVFSFKVNAPGKGSALHQLNGMILTATPMLSGGSIKGWSYGGNLAARFDLAGPGPPLLAIFEEMPEIGDRLPQDAIRMGNSSIAVAKRRSHKGYYIKRQGLVFHVAANENKLITYISATENFATPEGIRLSDPAPEIIDRYGSGIFRESKNVEVIPLPSGWYVKIANDRVLVIFKNKYLEQ